MFELPKPELFLEDDTVSFLAKCYAKLELKLC